MTPRIGINNKERERPCIVHNRQESIRQPCALWFDGAHHDTSLFEAQKILLLDTNDLILQLKKYEY